MTDHFSHLERPVVLAAEKAWVDHYESCPACQAATERTRRACRQGSALHEAAVRTAQSEYRSVHE